MSFGTTYNPSQEEKKYGVNRFWLPKNIGESIVLRLLPGFSTDPEVDPSTKRPYAYYRLHKVDFQAVGYDQPVARRIVCLDQFVSKKDKDSRKKVIDIKVTTENALNEDIRRAVARQVEDLKAICPLDAMSKQLELTYFTLKAQNSPKEVLDVAWRKYMDSIPKGLYFFNAVDKNGNHGVFEINSTMFKKIKDGISPAAAAEGLAVYSIDANGVWLKFTRISKGEKDNFSVEINTISEEMNGRKVKVTDAGALSPEVLSNLNKNGVDLDHFYDNSIISKEQALKIFMNEPVQLPKKAFSVSQQAVKPSTSTSVQSQAPSYEESGDDSDIPSVDEALGL